MIIGTLWGGWIGVVSIHNIKEIADLPEFLDFCFKKNWVYVEDNPFHRFPWMVWWSWKSEKVEWISLLHHISGWMKEVCTGWEKWEKGTFSISAPGLQSIRKQGLTEMMTMLNTDNGNYDASSSLPWCVLLNDILEIQTERMGREWKRHSFL